MGKRTYHGNETEIKVWYDRVVTETELAILLDINGDEVWLPLSAIDLDEDDKTVTMPESLATKKGLR